MTSRGPWLWPPDDNKNKCDGPGPVAVHVVTYHKFIAGLGMPPTHSTPTCDQPEGRPDHAGDTLSLSEPVADLLDEISQQTLTAAPHMWPHAHAVQGHPPGPVAGPEPAGLSRSPTTRRGLRSREAHRITQVFGGP